MSGYSFELALRSGKQQGQSDALSRRADYAEGSKASEGKPIIFFDKSKIIAANHNDPFPSLLDDILSSRDKDTDIESIIQQLNSPNFTEEIDAKWSLNANGLLLWDSLVYVPNDSLLRLLLLTSVHNSTVVGHPGINRTIEKFRRTYYFPQYRQYITNYVNACDVCHRSKSLRIKPHGFLVPLPIAVSPWKSISMDFIVKLPRSEEGNDSIFVIVDRFTKFAHFIPCQELGRTAPKMAKLYYKHLFANHGLPDDIVSDRGTVFTSDYWRSLQELTRTKLNMSTAFHPQSDGQTERINQSIEQYLRTYCNYNQSDWESLLPLAQFVYNDSYHSATKVTPFYANFGYHPQFEANPVSGTKNVDAENFVNKLTEIHDVLRSNLEEAAQRMKKQYDKKVSASPLFKIGDKVWLSAKFIKTQRPSINWTPNTSVLSRS